MSISAVGGESRERVRPGESDPAIAVVAKRSAAAKAEQASGGTRSCHRVLPKEPEGDRVYVCTHRGPLSRKIANRLTARVTTAKISIADPGTGLNRARAAAGGECVPGRPW